MVIKTGFVRIKGRNPIIVHGVHNRAPIWTKINLAIAQRRQMWVARVGIVEFMRGN